MIPEPDKEKIKKSFDPRRWSAKIGRMYCILLLLGATVLSGCATTGGDSIATGGATSVPGIGPQLSSNYGNTGTDPATDNLPDTGNLPKISVVVPVFDPNIPEDSDTWEKQGIYPELRRAEANRFALKMKSALEDTNAFGTVRVVPNPTTTAELYIIGKIIKSNGEDVKIHISATDVSGREWFTKNFDHRVKESFHDDIRNKGEDPYNPVFEEAAEYIVKKLKKYDAEDLAKLQRISEIRFGSSLSEETFAQYLKVNEGRVDLVAAPADDDPRLQRIQPIRVRDQLFIDEMQTHYTDFDQKLDESYLTWQRQSMVEVKAARKARSKSIAQGIIGGLLLVVGSVASEEASRDVNNPDVTTVVGGTATALVGAVVLGQSFQNRIEMKVHRDALAELGRSIDIEVAPQVVEYENETARLVGDASEQYEQWITFLKKIYDLEATPDKQL